MLQLCPQNWKDYELLDSGDGLKLERFGQYVTIRPEPQALWDRRLSASDWEKKAHVRFVPRSSSSGEWKKIKQAPDQWQISYPLPGNGNMRFRLGLTSFKHVGIFPEQAVNWDHIYNSLVNIKVEKPRFLNLFAYTGGASLAARAAGADVTHVDSVKQVITWANQNMELSGLKDIRWLVEDALKFVKREIKRGNRYHGIILDPPAYGHGPNGEKWKLEDSINEMVKNVVELLDPGKHFLILNAYSLGLSAMVVETLLQSSYSHKTGIEAGELFLPSSTGQQLPLGVFGRLKNF